MQEKFDKSEYDVNFRKEALKEKRKAQFNTDLDYEDKLELDRLLKERKITKSAFLRNAIIELKKENEIMKNKRIKEMMEYYEIESLDEFEPSFEIGNLKNGYQVQKSAIQNLKRQYSNEELILIENYGELGIVEYVASGDYHIENNRIIVED